MSNSGSPQVEATTNEVVAALTRLGAGLVADGRLSADEWTALLRDMTGRVILLDGIVGLYLGQVIAKEETGGSLEEIEASFDATPLAAHLDFEAFLAANREEGLVVVHAEDAQDWIRATDLTVLEERGEADYDDDGDLDLYLVNAPGGDNSLNRPALSLTAHDVDGDGEPDLGLNTVPDVPPVFLINLLVPAIQKVGA